MCNLRETHLWPLTLEEGNDEFTSLVQCVPGGTKLIRDLLGAASVHHVTQDERESGSPLEEEEEEEEGFLGHGAALAWVTRP